MPSHTNSTPGPRSPTAARSPAPMTLYACTGRPRRRGRPSTLSAGLHSSWYCWRGFPRSKNRHPDADLCRTPVPGVGGLRPMPRASARALSPQAAGPATAPGRTARPPVVLLRAVAAAAGPRPPVGGLDLRRLRTRGPRAGRGPHHAPSWEPAGVLESGESPGVVQDVPREEDARRRVRSPDV